VEAGIVVRTSDEETLGPKSGSPVYRARILVLVLEIWVYPPAMVQVATPVVPEAVTITAVGLVPQI